METCPVAISYTLPETLAFGESNGEVSWRSTSARTEVRGPTTAEASSAAHAAVPPQRPDQVCALGARIPVVPGLSESPCPAGSTYSRGPRPLPSKRHNGVICTPTT